MKTEATIDKPHAKRVQSLAKKLGVTSDQLLDEALDLFLRVAEEVGRGRRVVSVDPAGESEDCELAAPHSEPHAWLKCREELNLSDEEYQALERAIRQPRKNIPDLARLVKLSEGL